MTAPYRYHATCLVFVISLLTSASTALGSPGGALSTADDDGLDPAICASAEAVRSAEQALACATRSTGRIRVDGQLGEAAWATVVPVDNFSQREPEQGQPATERTEVRVIYDDEAIYIGARLHDNAPDSIVARLGRRDSFDDDADAFTFYIDPYNDKRSGYYFAVSAAGTLMDGVLMNDDWNDDTWDGVWSAAVSIDEQGWTAEMRIPYSQLRFHKKDIYAWGVNFHRFIARKNEADYLVYTPRGESGFVSRFAQLVGVQNIEPPRQVEITPYVTMKAEYLDVDPANPFNDGSRYVPGVGADFKVGLTSNLTLDATVNPDFGQVEVDPAVVNLSDFEVFFPERRPFFIEGANVFGFGFGGSNNNWGFNFGTPDFFYSRRVGRAPQGSTPDGTSFSEYPESTRILGAAKVTGKVGGGWNVGTIQALTGAGRADVVLDDQTLEHEVEPQTYYGVVRAQREFAEGRHGLGVISTTTARRFGNDQLRSEINSEAYVVGLDGWTTLDQDRVWVLTGWAGFSHVRGSEAQITRLQRSSLHYFQRPDADHVTLDSSATSLTGLSGRVALNKQSGRFYTNIGAGFIAPSFDINDAGFQWSSDVINAHAVVGYRWLEPRSFYRRINTYASVFQSRDFDGTMTWGGLWSNTWVRFSNFYSANLGFATNPFTTYSNRRTRGGPQTLNPKGWDLFGSAYTDSRKAWVGGVSGSLQRGYGRDENQIELEVQWRPAANLSLSVEPSLAWGETEAQWIDAYDDQAAAATFGRRYVFAELDQLTLSSQVRMNWTFTPNLSVQLFAQPLISTGNYVDYKFLDRPRSFDFTVFGEDGSTFDATTRLGDPDGDGPAAAFELPDSDFTFKSLRGTAVLRWEYRPGSTLFLVWTQQRADNLDDPRFRLDSALDQLWGAPADNIFMLKWTYWLSR
ncbi:MAG: DUF5916 domain-containing protein [Bacteroidota bacterium]